MADADPRGDYAAAWKALPRQERYALASDAARGLRGRNNKDAAFMMWWATQELRRGPWPGIAAAAGAAVVIIGVVLLLGDSSFNEGVLIAVRSPVIPIMVLIPVVTTLFRRPKLRQAIQLNAAVLSGRKFEGPPDPEEAARILARVKREGWLRGTRPEAEA